MFLNTLTKVLEKIVNMIIVSEYHCEQCGGIVSRTTKQCPHCGAWLALIVCTNCGFRGSEDDFSKDICPRCGNSIIKQSGCFGWLYSLLTKQNPKPVKIPHILSKSSTSHYEQTQKERPNNLAMDQGKHYKTGQLESLFGKPVQVLGERHGKFTESKKGCATPTINFSAGFWMSLFVLIILRGINFLASLTFMQGIINWLNSWEIITSFFVSVSQQIIANFKIDPKSQIWDFIHSLSENPGKTTFAIIIALVVGGLIDKKWRRIAKYGLACVIALILLTQGIEIIANTKEGPIIIMAPLSAILLLRYWSVIVSMLKGLFGPLFTSGHLTEYIQMEFPLLLVWQPFSKHIRLWGHALHDFYYWSYQYKYKPQTSSNDAVQGITKAIRGLEGLDTDVETLADLYFKTAKILRLNGRFDDALGYCEKIIKITQQELPQDITISALAESGSIWQIQGDEEKAKQFLEEALSQAEKYGSRRIFFETANQTAEGRLYRMEIDMAISLYKEILEVMKSSSWGGSGYFYEQSMCYLNLGNAHLKAKQYAESRKMYQESLWRFLITFHREERARVLLGLGQSYLEEYQTRYTRVESDTPSESQPTLKIKTSENVEVHFASSSSKEINQSVQYLEMAKRIADSLDRPLLDLEIREALASAYRVSSNLRSARHSAQHSIKILEGLQQDIFREPAGIRYAAPHSALYEIMVEAYIREGNLVAALEWMERVHARELVKRLRYESSFLLASDNVPPNLLTEEVKLSQQASALARELASGSRGRGTIAQERILSLKKQLEDIWGKIQTYDPLYVARRRGNPLDWEGMRSLLKKELYNCPVAVAQYFISFNKLYALLLLPGEADPKLMIKGMPNSNLEMLQYEWQQGYWTPSLIQMLTKLVAPIEPYLKDFQLDFCSLKTE